MSAPKKPNSIDMILAACEAAQHYRMTPNQLLVLLFLGKAKRPLTSPELAAKVGIGGGNMSATVMSLVNRGWITTEVMPQRPTGGQAMVSSQLSQEGGKVLTAIWEQAKREAVVI